MVNRRFIHQVDYVRVVWLSSGGSLAALRILQST